MAQRRQYLWHIPNKSAGASSLCEKLLMFLTCLIVLTFILLIKLSSTKAEIFILNPYWNCDFSKYIHSLRKAPRGWRFEVPCSLLFFLVSTDNSWLLVLPKEESCITFLSCDDWNPQKEWLTLSSLSCFHKCYPDLAQLVLQCCPLGSKVTLLIVSTWSWWRVLTVFVLFWATGEWVMSQPTCSSLLFSTVLLGSKHRSSDSVYWSWWRVIATLVCVLSHWGMGCATSPVNVLKCCWYQCCQVPLSTFHI